MNQTILQAASVLSDGRRYDGFALVCEDDRILALEGPDAPPRAGAEIQDFPGAMLVPGWIDLQVNGGFGLDLTEDPGALWDLASRLPEHGVTAFLPTIITAPLETYRTALAVLAAGPPLGHRGAVPLGFHFEGPFLAPPRKGAHEARHLRTPDVAIGRDWTSRPGVRLVTLAPELPDAFPLIAHLAAAGVVVAAGHSAADHSTARRAFAAGVRYVTHLFNAMPGLHHREPGLIGAALEDPAIVTGIIPDLLHVHPVVLDLVARIKGPTGLNIVTDAMGALGMPPGTFRLGGHDVQVDGLSARLPDGTLAGSIVAAPDALARFQGATGWPWERTVIPMTSTPAALLGDGERGRLTPGSRADVTVLTPEGVVLATYVSGHLAYRRPESRGR